MVSVIDRPSESPAEPASPPRRNKCALVTGASTGIGRVFAAKLAAKGYDLVVVARDEARLRTLATDLTAAHGVNVDVLVADLTDTAALRTIELRLANEPAIDLLVNNAGFGSAGPFHTLDIEAEERQVRLNVLALVRLTRAALPGMVLRGRGGVINVSSVAGFVPGIKGATYNATKAYVTSFTESLAGELSGTGVRVQALCPGFTRTEFHRRRRRAALRRPPGLTRTEFQERAGIDQDRVPAFAWDSAETVVDASLKALNRGTVICIPTFKYRFLVGLIRWVPRWFVRFATRMMGG